MTGIKQLCCRGSLSVWLLIAVSLASWQAAAQEKPKPKVEKTVPTVPQAPVTGNTPALAPQVKPKLRGAAVKPPRTLTPTVGWPVAKPTAPIEVTCFLANDNATGYAAGARINANTISTRAGQAPWISLRYFFAPSPAPISERKLRPGECGHDNQILPPLVIDDDVAYSIGITADDFADLDDDDFVAFSRLLVTNDRLMWTLMRPPPTPDLATLGAFLKALSHGDDRTVRLRVQMQHCDDPYCQPNTHDFSTYELLEVL